MDAIKKKMQVMRNERDTALDKGDQLEQKVSEQKAINEKVGTQTFLEFSIRIENRSENIALIYLTSAYITYSSIVDALHRFLTVLFRPLISNIARLFVLYCRVIGSI